MDATQTNFQIFDAQQFATGEGQEEYEDLWTRLQLAAEGQLILDAEDAENILNVFRKSLNADGISQPRDEIVASIIDCLGDDVKETDGGTMLEFLTTNYMPAPVPEMIDEQEVRNDKLVPKYPPRASSFSSLTVDRELEQALERISEWDFDVHRVGILTKTPLAATTRAAVRKFDMFQKIEFNEEKFENFIADIESAYSATNPYHNSLHAADVVQTCFHFLTQGMLMEASKISYLAAAGLLISGAIHDVNHPGVSNLFLVTTSAPLAIQYNDHSPLENMHLATAFTLMGRPENAFAEGLSAFCKKELRRIIIAMVLATDNDRHFSLYERLETLAEKQRNVSSHRAHRSSSTVTDPNIMGFHAATAPSTSRLNVSFDGDQKGGKESRGSMSTNHSLMARIESADDSIESSEAEHVRRASAVSAITVDGGSAMRDSEELNAARQLLAELSHSDSADRTSPVPERRHQSRNWKSFTLSRAVTRTNSVSNLLNAAASEAVPSPSLLMTPRLNSMSSMLSKPSLSRLSSMNSNTNPKMGCCNRRPSVTSYSSDQSHPNRLRAGSSPLCSTYSTNCTPSDPFQMLLLESTLHLADVSNPAKPWDVYQKWLGRVMEEFYRQGDRERELAIPITSAFDRQNPVPQWKFQTGFIKVIVDPLYRIYADIPGINIEHCLEELESNFDNWMKISEEASGKVTGI